MKVSKKQKKKIRLVILWGWQHWDVENSMQQIVDIIEKKKR